jgi:hypothetical protein
MVGEDDENEVAFAAAVMIVVGTSTLDGKNEVWRKKITRAIEILLEIIKSIKFIKY